MDLILIINIQMLFSLCAAVTTSSANCLSHNIGYEWVLQQYLLSQSSSI